MKPLMECYRVCGVGQFDKIRDFSKNPSYLTKGCSELVSGLLGADVAGFYESIDSKESSVPMYFFLLA